jgi:hypothetical protein
MTDHRADEFYNRLLYKTSRVRFPQSTNICLHVNICEAFCWPSFVANKTRFNFSPQFGITFQKLLIFHIIIVIISLLMSSLLWHRRSLWNTHKENGPKPTTQAQCGLVSANECNAARINVLKFLPKLGGARDNKFLVTHPMTNQRCLTSAIACRAH